MEASNFVNLTKNNKTKLTREARMLPPIQLEKRRSEDEDAAMTFSLMEGGVLVDRSRFRRSVNPWGLAGSRLRWNQTYNLFIQIGIEIT